MSSQTFVRNLGFGPKGYSQLNSVSSFKSIIVTGGSIEISKQHAKIQRIVGSNIPIVEVGENRSSLKSLIQISNNCIDQNINRLIVIGGGSIIDFGKRVYVKLIEANLDGHYELAVIPSRIGSGAESSMTSIVNSPVEKSIEVDPRFMPDTVIYDLDLFNTLAPSDLYLGSVDAISHLIESTNSFLSNSYVEFLSNASLKRYINFVYDYDFHQPSKKLLTELCLLSFNGGIAQNNAGAGLSHSLSHAAEKLLDISHIDAISLFLKPSLDFMTQYHPNSFTKFDVGLIKSVYEYIDHYNFKICNNSEKISLRFEQLQKITQAAPKDPCWKLMSQRVDHHSLLAYLAGNYETK